MNRPSGTGHGDIQQARFCLEGFLLVLAKRARGSLCRSKEAGCKVRINANMVPFPAFRLVSRGTDHRCCALLRFATGKGLEHGALAILLHECDQAAQRLTLRLATERHDILPGTETEQFRRLRGTSLPYPFHVVEDACQFPRPAQDMTPDATPKTLEYAADHASIGSGKDDIRSNPRKIGRTPRLAPKGSDCTETPDHRCRCPCDRRTEAKRL